MGVPTPGHGGGWGETFVAFLGWSFIILLIIMVLGVAIPFLVPIVIFVLGTYCYSLFCKGE